MAQDQAGGGDLPAWIARAWRILTHKNWALGGLLTLLVLCLDWSRTAGSRGHRWFYDQRVKDCQFFTPPPTDRLVFVDIDDAALDDIQHWPWPRTILAEIVDELHFAGADALSMDITMAEPQPPGVAERSDGTLEVIDHDANLAAAIRRFWQRDGPCFVLDSILSASRSPRYESIEKALHGDLELTLEDVSERIAARGRGHVERVDEDEFLTARGEARLSNDCRRAQARGGSLLDELRTLLLL